MNPKELLDQHDLLPRKSLGQNFLHDPNALAKIAAAAELTPDSTVLEIGPGTGTLTEVLAQRAKRVIAVEVDERLRPILEQRLESYPHVEVIYQDILETDIADLVGGGEYVVVANVPYYITSAILRHLLESELRPRRLILTMQLEVAERLIAKPGNMSVLSVSAQYYAQTRIIMRLKPGIFWPRPDVDSAVVRMDTFEKPPVSVPSDALFFRVVRAGFSQKRKQLKNSLGDGLQIGTTAATSLLERAGIDPRRRPETLTLEEWAAVTRQYADAERSC
jgi:16S rRNA (adenine1518-N6/adenine1519-N6)-dimethyltransferase